MPSSVSALSVLPPASPEKGDSWLSLPEVRRRLGLGEATIYRLIRRDPSFPRPVRILAINRWSAKEIAAWMESKLAARAAK